MDGAGHPPLQGDLWGAVEPAVDRAFTSIQRRPLARGAWIDHQAGWVSGADTLFHRLVARGGWTAARRRMYDRQVAVPRLTAQLPVERMPALGVPSALVEALEARYDTSFGPCWANYYRDGADSVAWHGDRIGRDRLTALVVVVSLGARRRFLLRPAGGGPSLRFDLGRGDLLVMGGTCQRTWEHAVPKAALGGPRISLTFRPRDESVPDRTG